MRIVNLNVGSNPPFYNSVDYFIYNRYHFDVYFSIVV